MVPTESQALHFLPTQVCRHFLPKYRYKELVLYINGIIGTKNRSTFVSGVLLPPKSFPKKLIVLVDARRVLEIDLRMRGRYTGLYGMATDLRVLVIILLFLLQCVWGRLFREY